MKKEAELLKKEAESLKETLNTKRKMLTARAESDKFKNISGINDVTEVLYSLLI